MRHALTVRLPGHDEITLSTDDPMPLEAARAWLDRTYVEMECVPSRASGKVLTADKLLSIAREGGAGAFADAAWAQNFARAAAGALGKPLIQVDVEMSVVGF
jgi:hypothetical protein